MDKICNNNSIEEQVTAALNDIPTFDGMKISIETTTNSNSTPSNKKEPVYLTKEQEKNIIKTIEKDLKKEFKSYEKMIDNYKFISQGVAFAVFLGLYAIIFYIDNELISNATIKNPILNAFAYLFPCFYIIPVSFLLISCFKILKFIYCTHKEEICDYIEKHKLKKLGKNMDDCNK